MRAQVLAVFSGCVVEAMMNDDEMTDSWFKRARAESTGEVRLGAESDSLAPPFAEATGDGWDPWEVWLRRIDQPRRNLAGGRLKLST